MTSFAEDENEARATLAVAVMQYVDNVIARLRDGETSELIKQMEYFERNFAAAVPDGIDHAHMISTLKELGELFACDRGYIDTDGFSDPLTGKILSQGKYEPFQLVWAQFGNLIFQLIYVYGMATVHDPISESIFDILASMIQERDLAHD